MTRTPHLLSRELGAVDAFLKQKAAKERGYCPHAPHPKQAEFLACNELDLLYGGGAGGGKSDAILMGALQYVHVPGYAALIVRESYADLALPGAIMDRAHSWLSGTDAKWRDVDKTYTFPSGARIVFGYIANESDKYRYQSSEFQYVGVDEGTQLPWARSRYLISRLRRPAVGALSKVPLRFRMASNPGGISHEAVRRHYVDPKTARAPFIPALLADNPSLDQEAYLRSLEELDETTRRQLRDGVWIRDASGLVYHFDDAKNRLARLPDSNGNPWIHVLGLDFGVTNATSFNVLAYRMQDPVTYVLRSFKRRGMLTGDAAAEYRKLDAVYKFSKVVGDVGGLGKVFAEEMRRRFAIPVEPAQKTDKYGFIKLLNGALEQRRLVTVGDGAAELEDEWATLPWKDETQQEEAPGFDNHCTDGTLYGWRACPNYHQRAAEVPASKEEKARRDAHRYWEQSKKPSKEWWDH